MKGLRLCKRRRGVDLWQVVDDEGNVIASCIEGDAWYRAGEKEPCGEDEARLFEALPVIGEGNER